MKLRPLVFGSILALGVAGAAIAQQQPDWNAIQITATKIKMLEKLKVVLPSLRSASRNSSTSSRMMP